MKKVVVSGAILVATLIAQVAHSSDSQACHLGCLSSWQAGTAGYDLDSGVYVELLVGFELVKHGVCVPDGPDCMIQNEQICEVRRIVKYKASHAGAEIEVNGTTLSGPYAATTIYREAWKRAQTADCNGEDNTTDAVITLTVGSVTVTTSASHDWRCTLCN